MKQFCKLEISSPPPSPKELILFWKYCQKYYMKQFCKLEISSPPPQGIDSLEKIVRNTIWNNFVS